MPTRNVVLTEHQESLINRLIESGRYQNASEVLREGLRMVERQEAEDVRLQAFRAAVQESVEAIERGEYTEFEGVGELADYVRKRGMEVIARAKQAET